MFKSPKVCFLLACVAVKSQSAKGKFKLYKITIIILHLESEKNLGSPLFLYVTLRHSSYSSFLMQFNSYLHEQKSYVGCKNLIWAKIRNHLMAIH